MKNILEKLFILSFTILLIGCSSPSMVLYEDAISHVDLPITAEQEVSIQFLGNTTLVIQDQQSRVIIDGFLTRPSFKELFFKRINHQEKTIDRILCQAGIIQDSPLQTRAIIPLHSHFDHIMDAPYVANKLGACMVMDETAKIIAEKGFPSIESCPMKDDKYSPDDDTLTQFEISVLDAKHLDNCIGKLIAPLGNVPEINSNIDFSKPQRAKHYKEGRTLNVFISHKKSDAKIFVIGGEFKAGDSESIKHFEEANIVFISTSLLDKGRSSVFYQLFDDLLKKQEKPKSKNLKKKIIPVHWDNFSRQIPVNNKHCAELHNGTYKSKNHSRNDFLKAPFILRSNFKDVKKLIEDNNQKAELRWITAYDQIFIK